MIKIDDSERIHVLRQLREQECFPIINRGKLWYDSLTFEQIAELKTWYSDWLNVTKTNKIPYKPSWLNDKIILKEDEVW